MPRIAKDGAGRRDREDAAAAALAAAARIAVAIVVEAAFQYPFVVNYYLPRNGIVVQSILQIK